MIRDNPNKRPRPHSKLPPAPPAPTATSPPPADATIEARSEDGEPTRPLPPPSPWLESLGRSTPITNQSLRLIVFVFPFAGGSTAAYATWPSLLNLEGIEWWGVSLPARGPRFREPLSKDRPLNVSAITSAITPHTTRAPFVFFGHSMGALLSYEVAQELRTRKLQGPSRIIVSGRRAPHSNPRPNPISHLDDGGFFKAVSSFGPVPKSLSADQTLMKDYVLPILRQDFAMLEYIGFQAGQPLLSCPISVYGGTEDEYVSRASLEAWREMTTRTVHLRLFEGDHMFIVDPRCESAVLKAMSIDLRGVAFGNAIKAIVDEE